MTTYKYQNNKHTNALFNKFCQHRQTKKNKENLSNFNVVEMPSKISIKNNVLTRVFDIFEIKKTV
jgi:hypothetical protein